MSGDITIDNAGVTAIGAWVIVDADVNASAAIAFSKLATLTSGNILVGSAGNVPTSVAMTGDVTITNAGVTSVALDKGTVTQITNINTAVTLDKKAGVITTVSLTAAAGTVAGTFQVNNSLVTANSVIVTTVEYASSATATPAIIIQDVTSGSFKVKVRNQSAAGSLNAVAKIHFAIVA